MHASAYTIQITEQFMTVHISPGNNQFDYPILGYTEEEEVKISKSVNLHMCILL